jgi:hypothetical protein
MDFVVPSRFRGPPDSGNGGWVCGHAAALLAGPRGAAVTVRLRTPPPLDRPMQVEASDRGMVVRDGEHVVLEAFLGETPSPAMVPAAVAFEEARAAEARYDGLLDHPFPTCFTCGTARDEGDGLRLRPGRVGDELFACTWIPAADTTVETSWAALDCPGGWASGFAGRPMVLGTMTGWLGGLPRAGEACVVVARARGSEGRRHFSTTASYGADGRLLGTAEATWVAVDPTTVRPAGTPA